ncbi:hypothetical protein LUZ60_005934 [Juncus effusus]|nr:hypothetical protein LUZ60_005934 [Juncus effusus]
MPPPTICLPSSLPLLPSDSRNMSENLLTPLFITFKSFTRSVQTHLSRFLIAPDSNDLAVSSLRPFLSFSVRTESPVGQSPIKEKEVKPLTKEELGRATWTLLHTIAAQYPDQPTRQQRRDVKELMAIISRLYPCKECSEHFKEILKTNPVHAGSQDEFSQWLCYVHNVVNRSIGKVTFPCKRVNARWGKLDCKDRSCDLEVSRALRGGKWVGQVGFGSGRSDLGSFGIRVFRVSGRSGSGRVRFRVVDLLIFSGRVGFGFGWVGSGFRVRFGSFGSRVVRVSGRSGLGSFGFRVVRVSGRIISSFQKGNRSGGGGEGAGQTIFIKGFYSSLGEDEIRGSLEKHFGQCGEFTRVLIPIDRETGYVKIIAYIVFGFRLPPPKPSNLTGFIKRNIK